MRLVQYIQGKTGTIDTNIEYVQEAQDEIYAMGSVRREQSRKVIGVAPSQDTSSPVILDFRVRVYLRGIQLTHQVRRVRSFMDDHLHQVVG